MCEAGNFFTIFPYFSCKYHRTMVLVVSNYENSQTKTEYNIDQSPSIFKKTFCLVVEILKNSLHCQITMLFSAVLQFEAMQCHLWGIF